MSGSDHFPPPSLHRGFSVAALAAVGDSVWAVGREAGPERAAHSAGGVRWELVADLAAPALLSAVAATTADDVWVVGHEPVEGSDVDRSYIAHRDAGGWRRVPSPNAPAGSTHLTAIAAQARDDALAVGASTASPPLGPLGRPLAAAWDPVVLRWDGSQWSIAPAPPRGMMLAVCCVGPGTYWAVGSAVPHGATRGGASVPLVTQFAGGQWHDADVPAEGPLFAVAATGRDDVWAVGQDQNPAHLGGPLILHFDGSSWETVETPAAPSQSWLADIACAAPDDVWAVGVDPAIDGGAGPLILHFDGSAWTRIDAPPDAAPTALQAVVARAGRGAWAAGFADTAMRDNGYPLSATPTHHGG